MASEDVQEEIAHEAAPSDDEPEASAPAAAEAPPEREASAEHDTLDEGDEAPHEGFFARLNPFRMMRRRSVRGQLEDAKDLLDHGSLAQATVTFHKVLKLDPNCVPAYRGLGKVFFKKGGRSNLETSLKYYSEAIRHAPMESDLYAITAKIYDTLGKRKEATLERKKFVIVRALDADARNPIANNNMGILFLQQGRMAEALDYFNRAVQADRNYDVAYRNLAAAYYQMAKRADGPDKKAEYNRKARDSIKRALDIAPTVPTLMAQARILLADGSLEQVLDILRRVDEMDPANPDVHLMMKMAYEGLGRFDEARTAMASYAAFKQQAEGGPPPEPDEAAE